MPSACRFESDLGHQDTKMILSKMSRWKPSHARLRGLQDAGIGNSVQVDLTKSQEIGYQKEVGPVGVRKVSSAEKAAGGQKLSGHRPTV